MASKTYAPQFEPDPVNPDSRRVCHALRIDHAAFVARWKKFRFPFTESAFRVARTSGRGFMTWTIHISPRDLVIFLASFKNPVQDRIINDMRTREIWDLNLIDYIQ